MTKYKKIIFKSVVPILLMVLFFSGCDSNRSGFDSSFDVALVATANTAKKTDIIYLDKNFKVLHKQSGLKYADFARGNTPPVVTGGHMYTAPRGTMSDADEHEIVDINLKDGKLKEYDIGEELDGPTVFSYVDGVMYVCRNLNGKSAVGSYNLSNSKIKIRNFQHAKDGCIMNMIAVKECLICGGNSNENVKNHLYILDRKTLKTLKKIQIQNSATGFSVYGEKVYITQEPENERGKYYIGIYDLKSKKYQSIPIDIKGNSMLRVMKWKNSLVIPDVDSTNIKSRFVVYDLKTGKSREIKFDDEIFQSQIRGNELFIFCCGKNERGILYRYAFDGKSLKGEKKLLVDDEILKEGGPSLFFLNNEKK